MAGFAEEAVVNAKANGFTLDYSPASIERVEKVLEMLYAELPHDGAPAFSGQAADDALDTARVYGGYIGEVLRRSSGGEWLLDRETDPSDPNPAIALQKGAKRVFPVDKVMKRLFNGTQDNVWFYYQMLAKHWA
jgi:hypothetical protein